MFLPTPGNSGGSINDCNMLLTKLPDSRIPFNLKGIPTFIIFFFTLCQCTNTAQAQIYASFTHRDYYMYDKNTEEFEYITGYDESSMFKINTKLTMFEHTTPDMTSSYFVSESEFDEEGNTLTMYVTSDVGNEYLYVFDLEDSEIIVLFKSDETPAAS